MGTWLVHFRELLEREEWPSTAEACVSSIYWALTTMSTIGYGDIVAVTNSERLVSIAIMLVGSVIFGVVVGGMTNMVAQLDSLNVRAQERLDIVKAMLRDRKIPKELIRRTKSYSYTV